MNVSAQSVDVLDSLRYFSKVTSYYNYAYEGVENVVYGKAIWNTQLLENNKRYLNIDNFVGGGFDVSPFGSTYERVDSTTGIVYRSVESFKEEGIYAYNGPMDLFHVNLGFIYNSGQFPFTISRTFKDSTEYPIERLYFETQPQIGDTVLFGGARLTGNPRIGNYTIDSIAYKDIAVVYKGYREATDRELGFDNPVDTLIKMIDFEIRNTKNQDSLLIYTLAKDIGLLEASLFLYKTSPNQTSSQLKDKAQLYNSDIQGRKFTRLGLYVSNETNQEIPNSFSFESYPNPFNPTTTIRYSIPNSGSVTIQIYDALGRLNQNLEKAYKTSGSHTVQFDAKNLSSGLYLVRVQFNDEVKTGKIVLLK